MDQRVYYKIIILITLLFSLLVGSKFYGFGHDYYVAYYKQNLDYGWWYDRLGFAISTLTIYNMRVGVYIVSFLLALSFGLLLQKFFFYKKLNSVFFFILIYILGLHTWPIIMSTSNAMRQGITMSLIFLTFAYLIDSKKLKSFFPIFISIFTHKSGVIFFLIYIYLFIIKFFFNYKKINKYRILIYIISGLLVCITFYYLILYTPNIEIQTSRIISKDYRYPFLITSFAYVSMFIFYFKFLKNNYLVSFLYLFIFMTFALILLGLNWEYERFMMMVTLPLILVFSLCFNKRSSYLYLFLAVSMLLVLTIFNGMYKSLV